MPRYNRRIIVAPYRDVIFTPETERKQTRAAAEATCGRWMTRRERRPHRADSPDFHPPSDACLRSVDTWRGRGFRYAQADLTGPPGFVPPPPRRIDCRPKTSRPVLVKAPMTEDLSAPGRALAHAATAWLAGEMFRALSQDTPAPHLLRDEAQSNFEIACMALERAGVLASAGSHWRVLQRGYGGFVLPGGFDGAGLDLLLAGVSAQAGYVAGWAEDKDGVTPDGPVEVALCEALVGCGYMEAPRARRYGWTEAFGPWRVWSGAWSLLEFEPATEEERAEALARLPAAILARIGATGHAPEFLRLLFAQWRDGGWSEAHDWRNVPSDDWDLGLAAGLYLHLHGA